MSASGQMSHIARKTRSAPRTSRRKSCTSAMRSALRRCGLPDGTRAVYAQFATNIDNVPLAIRLDGCGGRAPCAARRGACAERGRPAVHRSARTRELERWWGQFRLHAAKFGPPEQRYAGGGRGRSGAATGHAIAGERRTVRRAAAHRIPGGPSGPRGRRDVRCGCRPATAPELIPRESSRSTTAACGRAFRCRFRAPS